MKKRKNYFILLALAAVGLAFAAFLFWYQYFPKTISSVSLTELNEAEEHGFTCTGLTYDKKKQVFYVADFGKIQPEYEEKPSVFILSKDLKTVIDNIEIWKSCHQVSELQGITIDKEETLWVCSFKENKVRRLTKKGTAISEFSVSQPSGITYDEKRDCIWVLTLSKLIQFSKEGETLFQKDVIVNGQDQLFYDADADMIYFTAGTNYQGGNYVYRYDIAKDKLKLSYILRDSNAVEGLYIENGVLYVCNDGYYHKAKDNQNCIKIYKIR